MATNIYANPATPGIATEIFIPDQLIAGNLQLVTETVTLVSGAGALARGTVLGKITASGKYTKSATASSDGSQTPVAILADAADSTSGDVLCGVYLMGEFNSNALTLGTGWTTATVAAALRASGIFVKTLATDLSNADPS